VPGEPPDHALGRSRGGLSTKVHALSDLTCTPVIALLTAGQGGDNPMLATLVQALGVSGHDQDLRLLADKAYCHPSTRTFLRDKKIKHTIPERSDQIAHRKAKGSKAADRPGSTPRPTSSATRSNAPSAGSSNGADWPPATTSTP
jgi:putative transposase